jgi:PAS domain S-box-containing protein
VNEALEATVAERTAHLFKANEQLKSELMERKRAEEALRKSERRVRRKLDAILSPEGDISTLELSDIIDSERIQKLMDQFHRLTRIGIGIIDLQGRVLVATGWQDICTKFHRSNPESRRLCIESDLELSRGVPAGTFKRYRCKNNMWDIATPILLGDRHVGNIFLGQFLFDDETADYETFRQQARRYGFNEREYIEALDRVPKWSMETVDAAMAFYTAFAGMIGNLSYSNIKLASALEERRRAEEEISRVNRALRMLSLSNQALIHITDESTLLNEVCRIAVDVGGYRMAWVGFAEQDEAKTVRPVAYAGFDSGYIESAGVTWADNEHGRSPSGTAIRTGQPCIAYEISSDPVFAPWREEAGKRGYKSSIALPLISEGRTLGMLGIYSGETDTFEAEKFEILKELADDLAFGITALRTRDERNLAEEALRNSEKEKTILNEIARIFLTVPDEAMYGEVLSVVLRVTNSGYGTFGFIDEQGNLAIPSLTRDIWNECRVPDKSIVFPADSWGNSMWGRAIREKRTFCSAGPFHTPEGHVHIDHFLVVPMVFGRETIGLISVANNDKGYTGKDRALLERIADYVSPILRARLQRDALERKRKAAVELLSKSERSLKEAQRIAHLGSWEFDIAKNRLRCSDEVNRIFGLMPEEFDRYETFLETVHPDDRTKIAALYEDSIREDVPFDTVYRIIKKEDGVTRYVHSAYEHEKDETGKVVRSIGTVHDITELKEVENELQATSERLRMSLNAIIQAMALVVETRDPYTAGHQRRVANLAIAIATEMEFPINIIDGVNMAATIHDIGKIAVPTEILSKPTILSDLEFCLIKSHAQAGYDILKDFEFPWPVARTILQHHERMDGSGYPNGLKGDEILLEARIMAVADVVEAMASHRPYRPALGIKEALEEIEKNKGTLYDSDVADACLKLFREKNYRIDES